MGWTIPYDTHSRDQLVDWLLHHLNEPGYCEIVDHSRRGNVLYLVFHDIPKQSRFIAVFLLEGPTPAARHAGDRAWGYKDMDESMGPCVYDCPERLLRQSDDQRSGAVEWREACRQERRNRAARRKLSAACQRGDRLRYQAGWTSDGPLIGTVTFVRHATATFFIGKDLEGAVWRYRWSRVMTEPSSAASSREVA
nr:hypothetical protein [uncultured Halomonas sp.]